jgi:transposase
MFTFGGHTRIWLATGVTDLRRGFTGLHALIAQEFGQSPLNGDFYVFANRRRDLLKIFFYDTGGLWVCGKRLERGTYRWPQPGQKIITLNPAELQLLVSGIDLRQTQVRSWWRPAGLAPTSGAASPQSALPDSLAAGQSRRSSTPRDRSPPADSFPLP